MMVDASIVITSVGFAQSQTTLATESANLAHGQTPTLHNQGDCMLTLSNILKDVMR